MWFRLATGNPGREGHRWPIANEGALVFPCRFIFYLFLGGSLFFTVSRVLSFVERSLGERRGFSGRLFFTNVVMMSKEESVRHVSPK